MSKLVNEFKQFAVKGNAVDMPSALSSEGLSARLFHQL